MAAAATRSSPAEHASHALLLVLFLGLAAASVYPLLWLVLSSLKTSPVSAFPVERVADAHRALESGDTVGKLVLTFAK